MQSRESESEHHDLSDCHRPSKEILSTSPSYSLKYSGAESGRDSALPPVASVEMFFTAFVFVPKILYRDSPWVPLSGPCPVVFYHALGLVLDYDKVNCELGKENTADLLSQSCDCGHGGWVGGILAMEADVGWNPTSRATSCFVRPTARILGGWKQGKQFCHVYHNMTLVETAPSSFPTEIAKRNGSVNGPLYDLFSIIW